MVYIDTNDLGWFPYVVSWMQRLKGKFSYVTDEIAEYIINLFDGYVEKGWIFIRKNGIFAIHQVK